MDKVKCLLCEGTMPADDLEAQVEHMLCWHKATSKEEAERMAKDNFVNPYLKGPPAAPYDGFQPVDRREHPRKKFKAKLIVNSLNTSDSHVGWIQNISMGGIRVETEVRPRVFAREEEVGIVSDIGAFTLVGNGRVIWISDIGNEVGIKFTHLVEETRRPLENFLRSLP